MRMPLGGQSKREVDVPAYFAASALSFPVSVRRSRKIQQRLAWVSGDFA